MAAHLLIRKERKQLPVLYVVSEIMISDTDMVCFAPEVVLQKIRISPGNGKEDTCGGFCICKAPYTHMCTMEHREKNTEYSSVSVR